MRTRLLVALLLMLLSGGLTAGRATAGPGPQLPPVLTGGPAPTPPVSPLDFNGKHLMPTVEKALQLGLSGSPRAAGTATIPSQATNLGYFLGPVLHNTLVYPIFWLPGGYHFE